MGNQANKKIKGALLTFVIVQLCYLFFFFIRFPDSFRNAIDSHFGVLVAVSSWLSTLTMLGYCIVCMASVAQLALRKHGFLLWFQISGIIALVGNFVVYILRQIDNSTTWSYEYFEGDYYWILFIMALFWTVIWSIYFARSSRVFSYMGEDTSYLKTALFTKNVQPPAPWVEPAPGYLLHTGQGYPLQQNPVVGQANQPMDPPPYAPNQPYAPVQYGNMAPPPMSPPVDYQQGQPFYGQVPPQPYEQVPPQPYEQVPPQPYEQVPPQPYEQVPPQPYEQVPPQPYEQVPPPSEGPPSAHDPNQLSTY